MARTPSLFPPTPYSPAEGAADLPSLVLLHGMLGGVDNWNATARALRDVGYPVYIPALPVYDAPLAHTTVEGLTAHVLEYLDASVPRPWVLVGNSLGGHVALCAAAQRPQNVHALVLAGSSGLDEVSIGATTPRRFDRGFVRDRTAFTFHDPAHATDALVDQMMDVLADRGALLRLVKMARSARDTRVDHLLPLISMPTLLVWGKQDRITPPEVALAFDAHLPHSTLCWIDACGHAPMIEHPALFTAHLLDFLQQALAHSVYAA